jgi:hypothetical protein
LLDLESSQEEVRPGVDFFTEFNDYKARSGFIKRIVHELQYPYNLDANNINFQYHKLGLKNVDVLLKQRMFFSFLSKFKLLNDEVMA